MAKIEWSIKAQESLDERFEYTLNTFGEKTAQRFYEKVFKDVKRLETFPEIGFPEPLLSKGQKISEPTLCKSLSKWYIITTKTPIPYILTTFGTPAAILKL